MSNAAFTSRLHISFAHIVPRGVPNFPVKLSLSDDSTIESVLTDIPLFCVGLLAFAIFTFFLVMKRVNLLVIYLYSSSLLAFAAAILDLSQILAQARPNADKGIAPHSVSVSGLIITREIGHALSFGFRFIFFWTFVARRPRGEPPPIPPEDRKKEYNPREHSHSASWQRWGILGITLKWVLLVASISIPILQIVWRDVPGLNQFGGVYTAEATLEIVVSALFILKLLLNVSLFPLTPRWRSLRSYAAPLLALLISAGLGIGNLIYFAFSETTFGRFLQAVELYILILFILIATFYKAPINRTAIRPRKNTTSSFAGLQEKSVFPLSPTIVRTPGEIVVIGRPISSPDGREARPSRASTASRLSSWINPRMFPRFRGSGERQLWNQDDAERGISPAPQETSTATDSPRDLDSRVAELKESQAQPVIALETKPWTRRSADLGSTALPATTTTADGRAVGPPTRSPNLPSTTFSIASYYGASRVPSLVPKPREVNSPVYGLNGIVDQSQYRNSVQGLARPPSNANSFDELLRQQTELDRSIAALRLFSPQPAGTAFSPLGSTLKKSPSGRTISSTPTSGGNKPDSASARSEFSLSNFPDPPLGDVNSLFPSTTSRLVSLREKARTKQKDDVPVGLVPIKIPNEDTPSLPGSPTQTETMTRRFDSAGTQYDVTSFIGDLTGPPTGFTGLTSAFRAGILSGIESGDETDESPTIFKAAARTTQTMRPILLGSTLPPIGSGPSFAPATASSGVLTASLNSESQPPKAFSLSASSPAVPSSLSASLSSRQANETKLTFAVPRKPPGRRAMTSRPRPRISGPRPPPQDGKGDQAPGAFERPRPPPLRLQQSDIPVTDTKGKGILKDVGRR